MTSVHKLSAARLKTIQTNFGSDFISIDPSDLQLFGRDWTRVFTPDPSALARPKNTQEVARFLAFCQQHRLSVVPSGGRTGYAGGAVAAQGEIVLSLERMRNIQPIDQLGGTLRVQAGAITQAVHEHCHKQGFLWPIDFASKGSSQIGGNIATNAGGVKVIRYGLTRHWVLGLQVVLPNGEILELNGALEKNNTGIDLRQLFIGSEGILGVITEATLKLTKLPQSLDVYLFAAQSLQDVLQLFQQARLAPGILAAFEFFTDRCLKRLTKHRQIRPVFGKDYSHYILVEIENGLPTQLDAWLNNLFEKGLVQDGVHAENVTQARELWQLREGISESLAATGFPHKNDVALPIAALPAFCADLETFFAAHYPGWEICNFGHIGDGNLHINVMKPDTMSREEFLAKTGQTDEHIFTLVQKHHGSISAEHGIGLLKKKHLHFTRTPTEIAFMKQLKATFDPHGILNPGKIFDFQI